MVWSHETYCFAWSQNFIIVLSLYMSYRYFLIGLSTIIVQIPIVDKFRWSGWYLLFHGLIQILLITVVFKENWTDLKRTSIDCKRLSIFNGIAVPRYVSFNNECSIRGSCHLWALALTGLDMQLG